MGGNEGVTFILAIRSAELRLMRSGWWRRLSRDDEQPIGSEVATATARSPSGISGRHSPSLIG